MFFVISKLFFAFARPFHFLLLLMIAGIVLQIVRRPRIGVGLINVSAVLLVIVAFTPLAFFVETPLETRFPRPSQIDPAPDGIIILGGALDTPTEAGRPDFISLNDAAERLTEIPRLARLYPNARIIYTGGPDRERFGTKPEAQSARDLLIQLGIPAERITIEERSLTTWENATMTKDIIKPAADSRWLLVTSAFHTPRSVGTFRAAGWPGIIAYPTDYRLPDPKFGVTMRSGGIENVMLLEIAAKEWFGMLGYWLTGRSSSLFPAP